MELSFTFTFSLIIFLSFLIIAFTVKLSKARRDLFEGDEKIKELDSRVQELEGIIRNLQS